VDFLMYALADDAERYSAQDTIAAQGNIFLRTGSVLLSNEGNPMATVLGTSVASLGDPARSGFWLETPLVSSETEGRVVFPGTGKSAQVQLIPIEGPATGGSRISLSAMRLIGAPLTDLPTLEVYSGG